MTISVDWVNKVVSSTASITDLPAFHATLRDLEDDEVGVIYPVIHKWKALDLGGGAFMYQADFINGYVLEFVGAGPFQINGNLNAPINDTGVQVERKTSAAYATTEIGGSGPSAESIAAAVLVAMNSLPPRVNAAQINGSEVIGSGTTNDPWRNIGTAKRPYIKP